MTTTFDFFAGGLTDFVMPPCAKLGDYAEAIGEDLYPLAEQDGSRAVPFVNDDANWVNSLFQPQPTVPPSLARAPLEVCPHLLPPHPPELFSQALPFPEKQAFTYSVAEVPSSPEESKFAPIEVLIQNQPPVRVRTRTPNEIRTFSVGGCLTGNWFNLNAKLVRVSLAYAAVVPNGRVEPVAKDILGGTKTVPVKEDGSFRFSNLSVSESSTKHNEKEFCLHFTVIGNDGMELLHQLSESFYAYSHKKVLQRRETIKLRELSKTASQLNGGEVIHLVGFPFKQSSNFEVIFRTCYGDLRAQNYEFFSESVLYFQIPACPVPPSQLLDGSVTEVKATVVVTNDGKLFSNGLEFTYRLLQDNVKL